MIIGLYLLITLLLSGLYSFLLIYILKWWSEIPDYTQPQNNSPTLQLSILIPARNEAKNILQCLNSVLKSIHHSQHEVELIVIDDHSSDGTATLVQNIQNPAIKLLHLKNHLQNKKVNAYKKAALAYGLEQASGSHVIQLDADVIVPIHYISQLGSALINTQAQFLAAPVVFYPDNTLLGQFQCLDMLGMMLLTGAGIESKQWYMANGANMVYKKELASYDDSEFASGDDIFTIQQIASNSQNKVHFLKSPKLAVVTQTESGYRAFWNQRLRWATKNKHMKNPKMLLMMAIPFLNACWLVIQSFLVIGGSALIHVTALFHLLSLVMIDYIFLAEAAKQYGREQSLRYFLPSFFLHKIYLVLIGLSSLIVKKYNWKKRVVS